MSNKILKSILLISSSLLISSLILTTLLLYQHFGQGQEAQLKEVLTFVALETEKEQKAYLESLPANQYRITWIAPSGEVLYDNQIDLKLLKNHNNREEIIKARTNGSVSSSRYSSTLTEKTFYEALRLKDGSILRVSISHDSVMTLLFNLLKPLLLVFIIFILVSIWLAKKNCQVYCKAFKPAKSKCTTA